MDALFTACYSTHVRAASNQLSKLGARSGGSKPCFCTCGMNITESLVDILASFCPQALQENIGQ